MEGGGGKRGVGVYEGWSGGGVSEAQLKKVSVIYLGTHSNATTALATVVIPGLTVFEKNGTFVNQQFRIQKFYKAVPAPAGIREDVATLSQLATRVGAGSPASTVEFLWAQLATDIPTFATSTFQNLPATGLLLDSTAWANLPFCEGENLHF